MCTRELKKRPNLVSVGHKLIWEMPTLKRSGFWKLTLARGKLKKSYRNDERGRKGGRKAFFLPSHFDLPCHAKFAAISISSPAILSSIEARSAADPAPSVSDRGQLLHLRYFKACGRLERII